MPIASYKPTAALPVQPATPKAEPDNYKGIIYDDNNVPLQTLIAYIEGAPWYVDYYGQVTGKHNDLREIDPGQDKVYQQYQKITALELRVQTDLQTSYDNDTGITTTTGAAAVYPFMIPNKADYFVTDAGSARKAIFRIETVERRTFNRDSVFDITYSLVGYIETEKTLYADLEAKTIRQYYFSKDRLVEGLPPILKAEEYHKVSNLKEMYEDIVQFYFRTFFNRKYMTLPVPGQAKAIYDGYLVNYILKIVEMNDAPDIKYVKQVPTDHNRFLAQPQFWDAMLNKDFDSLKYAHQHMVLANKLSFNGNGWIEGFRFYNFDFVVFPQRPDTTADVGVNCDNYHVVLNGIWNTANVNNDPSDVLNELYVTKTASINLYPRILSHCSYVLSCDFYTQGSCQTVLEILTRDYMQMKTLDLDMLYALYNKYKGLARLEQFYYGPILLTLIKEANRAQYT
jgi:hypothetical protein